MLTASIVGTGRIARKKHLPAWKNLGKLAELEAVCDLDADQARKTAKEFSIDDYYSDFGKLLDEKEPDIVDICTPPTTHADLAVQALESGANILIEKPMAMDADECDRIIQAAERTDGTVTVGHSDLFYPAFREAQNLVEEGEIGTFRGMRILFSTPTDYMTADPDHWANDLPGGVIGETGPHAVYLTLAFIQPIQEIHAIGHKLLDEYEWSPYEDYRVRLAGDGAVSTATFTYTTDHWAAEVDLWGTDGMLKVDLESQVLTRHERPNLDAGTVGRSALSDVTDRVYSAAKTTARHALGRDRSTHDVMIQEFCEAVAKGEPAPVTAREGREAVRAMNQITDQLEK